MSSMPNAPSSDYQQVQTTVSILFDLNTVNSIKTLQLPIGDTHVSLELNEGHVTTFVPSGSLVATIDDCMLALYSWRSKCTSCHRELETDGQDTVFVSNVNCRYHKECFDGLDPHKKHSWRTVGTCRDVVLAPYCTPLCEEHSFEEGQPWLFNPDTQAFYHLRFRDGKAYTCAGDITENEDGE